MLIWGIKLPAHRNAISVQIQTRCPWLRGAVHLYPLCVCLCVCECRMYQRGNDKNGLPGSQQQMEGITRRTSMLEFTGPSSALITFTSAVYMNADAFSDCRTNVYAHTHMFSLGSYTVTCNGLWPLYKRNLLFYHCHRGSFTYPVCARMLRINADSSRQLNCDEWEIERALPVPLIKVALGEAAGRTAAGEGNPVSPGQLSDKLQQAPLTLA